MLAVVLGFVESLFQSPAFSGLFGALIGILFGGWNALRVQKREWEKKDHEYQLECVANARLRCIKLGTTLLMDPSLGTHQEKIGGGGGTRQVDTPGRREAFSFIESLLQLDNALDNDRLRPLKGGIFDKFLKALHKKARRGTPNEPLDEKSEPAMLFEEIYDELTKFERRCTDELTFMKNKSARHFS